jgi:hypothetical protein
MLKLIILVIVSIFIYVDSPSQTIIDPLHGIKVKNVEKLSGFFIIANSKIGKLVIRKNDEPAGISMFVMRKSKSRDPIYPLKILSIPFGNNQVFYKINGNVINAVAVGNYLNFSTFFDTGFARDLFIYGWANSPAKGYINIVSGKKYYFVTVFLPTKNVSLKALLNIASNVELIKPTEKYKSTGIYSKLVTKKGKLVKAVYVDLPVGYRISGGTVLPKNMTEVPFFCVENKKSKACTIFIYYQFFNYSSYLTPIAVAQLFSPIYKRTVQTNLYFKSEIELINFYLRSLGVQIQPKHILTSNGIYPLSQMPKKSYEILGNNLIGYYDLLIGEVFMPPNGYSKTYVGALTFAYGKTKEDFQKAFGAMISFLYNPYWVSEITKFSFQEAKKEMEHSMWMWKEFRKTMDYINKLHHHSIKEWQIYQEEMARAASNILSDYTYIRDPETGEIFHIEDDAKEYWRDNENNIVKLFEPEEIDRKLLKTLGWRKMEYRLEGFGQW